MADVAALVFSRKYFSFLLIGQPPIIARSSDVGDNDAIY
jgi:hypothetical protein